MSASDYDEDIDDADDLINYVAAANATADDDS